MTFARTSTLRASLRRGVVIAGAVGAVGIVTGTALANGGGASISSSRVACGDVYGPHGLVAAINAANAATTPQTIILAKGCDYTLTMAQPALCCVSGAQDGLPPITGQVTLVGGGSVQGGGATLIRQRSSAPAFRILEVAPGGKLVLKGMNVQFGDASTGGGVYNAKGGTLTTIAAAILANHAERSGGGIENAGTAVITGTTRIEGNTIGAFEADQGAFGGGIDNSGSLRLDGSIVSNNNIIALSISNGLAQGGGIRNLGAMSLTSSTVSGNIAESDTATGVASGGGIETGPLSSSLRQSTIESNSASATNGGSTRGGGIHLRAGHLDISAGTIDLNHANGAKGDGGGIYVTAGTATLNGGATVVNNTPDNCDLGPLVGCTG